MTYEKHKTCIFSRSFSKEALREAYRIASRCCELPVVVIIFRVFVARVQVKAGIFSARTRHRLTVLLQVRHVTTAKATSDWGLRVSKYVTRHGCQSGTNSVQLCSTTGMIVLCSNF